MERWMTAGRVIVLAKIRKGKQGCPRRYVIRFDFPNIGLFSANDLTNKLYQVPSEYATCTMRFYWTRHPPIRNELIDAFAWIRSSADDLCSSAKSSRFTRSCVLMSRTIGCVRREHKRWATRQDMECVITHEEFLGAIFSWVNNRLLGRFCYPAE